MAGRQQSWERRRTMFLVAVLGCQLIVGWIIIFLETCLGCKAYEPDHYLSLASIVASGRKRREERSKERDSRYIL